MSTKIGIVADTHSTVAPLREALDIFKREGVTQIICAGDIVGYGEDNPQETINLLKDNNCLIVIGNHDCIPGTATESGNEALLQVFFDSLPKKIELTVEEKRIYIVHAHPPDELRGGIKILNPEGVVVENKKNLWTRQFDSLACDVLIVGHTHQVFAEYFGRVLVINPGSTCFNHTCMILSLPEMTVETFSLSGKQPVPVWNWGIYYQDTKI